MSVYRVKDVLIDDLARESYDLAFFASGAEARCTNVAKHIDPAQIPRCVLLGFDDEHRKDPVRFENDDFFLKWNDLWPENAASFDQTPVLRACARWGGNAARLRILVDYSCMSSLWYSAVLNWARLASRSQEVVIDFAYSPGTYPERTSAMAIEDILAIPGCEGGAMRSSNAIAILGLGFQSLAALCVLERLEPYELYTFLSSPGSVPMYVRKVKELNREMLEQHSRKNFEFPLESVATTYIGIGELVSSYIMDSDVTLVPMGPKPHVLACILLSMRFEQIACLRVSGKDSFFGKVKACGPIVCTRVVVRPASESDTVLPDHPSQ